MKITPVFYSHPIYNPQKTTIKKPQSPVSQTKAETNSFLQSVSFKHFYCFGFQPSKRMDNVEDFLNFNLNFIKYDSCSENEYSDLLTSNQSMQAFSSALYSATRLEYYSKGGITNGEFVNLLKKQEVKEIEDVLAYVKSNSKVPYIDVVRTSLEMRQGFFKYLVHELSKLEPNGDFLKDGDDVMIDIATSYYDKFDKQFDKYNKSIKKQLEYSPISPMIKLDLQEEIDKLPIEKQKEIDEKFNGDYNKMLIQFIAEGCLESRAPIEYSQGVDTALIHMLPRYEQKKKNKIFPIEPFSRRISISDMDEFMKSFKTGKLYSYPRTQSCSKSMRAAESWFSDRDRALNVIFRIHPKSKLTKAFDLPDIDVNKETNYKYYDDMHERKFRHEVLYPPNTKFKVLGACRYIQNNYHFKNRAASDYYKTVIDLQEV